MICGGVSQEQGSDGAYVLSGDSYMYSSIGLPFRDDSHGKGSEQVDWIRASHVFCSVLA